MNHELHNGSGGKELPDFAPERASKEAFESYAFDVLAGVRQVVFFKFPNVLIHKSGYIGKNYFFNGKAR